MYLSRVVIKNFRSIEYIDLAFTQGKNILVGRNNSGKSNILDAINLILGENSPDYKKGENVTESDFYTKRIKRGRGYINEIANEMFVYCELIRTAQEPLDFDEMYKCFGFYVYSDRQHSAGRQRIVTEPINENYNNIFNIDEDVREKTYLNPKLRNQQTFENEFNDKYNYAFAFRATRSDSCINKEIRMLYRENDQSGWILAFKASIRNVLIQSAILPSFRDPQNQLRISNWTWYGKLLKHLTSSAHNIVKLQKAFAKLQDIANEVFETAQEQMRHSTIAIAFPGTQIFFQFAADKNTDIHKSCVIYVDDGFKSLLTDKGSGIQSVIIIGLFNYYTKEVNTTGSALLGVEEPELYLHPHAQRVLSDRFDDFLDNNRNQVIITTHSVEFLRSISTDVNIIYVNKLNNRTTAKSVSLRQVEQYLREQNQNEIFFADKVIVCEGLDDFILRAISRETHPGLIDEKNVSIVSVNGKDNIDKLVGLILNLGIECYAFADFDYILRDKSADRNAFNAPAHDSICSLPQRYYEQNCIYGKHGRQVVGLLNGMRAKIKRNSRREFYTGKIIADVTLPNLNAVTALLRQHGIGILDGDIECYSLDQGFLSLTNKITLDKLYQIRSQLSQGRNASQIFDNRHVREFINAVLSPDLNAKTKYSAIKAAIQNVR